jgi:hypothetical protein
MIGIIWFSGFTSLVPLVVPEIFMFLGYLLYSSAFDFTSLLLISLAVEL